MLILEHAFCFEILQRLAKSDKYEDFPGFSSDETLPINNGREVAGESVVVDFESKHFVGTLLLRIKQAPSRQRGKDEISHDENGKSDYFANKKRKFQVVIKGRFKKDLPMSRCVTGQTFDRPAGKLPARWLVQKLIQFFTILAPQLDGE